MNFFLKELIGILTIIFLFEINSAQTEKKNKEFSFSGSYIFTKHNDYEPSWKANLATRFGLFITKNIEVEPEVVFSPFYNYGRIYKPIGLLITCNVAYNFNIKIKDRYIIPFILGGYGYSNGWLYLPDYVWPTLKEKHMGTLVFGGGFKIPLTDSILNRLEYRYLNYNKFDCINQMILFGISIILK